MTLQKVDAGKMLKMLYINRLVKVGFGLELMVREYQDVKIIWQKLIGTVPWSWWPKKKLVTHKKQKKR